MLALGAMVDTPAPSSATIAEMAGRTTGHVSLPKFLAYKTP